VSASLSLGIDIGSVALKAVLVGHDTAAEVPEGFEGPVEYGGLHVWFGPYVRTLGKPREVAEELLALVRAKSGLSLTGVRLTGSAAGPVAESWKVIHENEFLALAGCGVLRTRGAHRAGDGR